MRVLVAMTAGTGDDRKALAAVPALAAGKAHVTVVADRLKGMPLLSRFCSGKVLLPNPCSAGPESFLSALREHLESRPCDALLPVSDNTNIPVSRNREVLSPWVGTAVPDARALDWANDKWQTLETAGELGIDLPRTILVTDPAPRRLP